MTWNDIADFTNNQVVRVNIFQQLWQNLYHTKDPMHARVQLPGDNNDIWTYATTNTWADIDSTNYAITFETGGNDFLAIASVRHSHSAAGGFGYTTFMLDGVRYGNTFGLTYIQDIYTNEETIQMAYIFQNIAAGNHTLKVQWYNENTGNLEAGKNQCLSLWVAEL